MSTATSTRSNGGIGIVGLLTIVFIVLKLIGQITWSWWWVLSPLWILTGFILVVIIIGIMIALIVEMLKCNIKRR